MPEVVDKKTTREEYGKVLEKLKVGDAPIKIPIADQQRILQYVRRKYFGTRSYTTKTVGTEMYIFRVS